MQPTVSISVVSHHQASLLPPLIEDLAACSVPLEILVTLNVPEQCENLAGGSGVRFIVNTAPKGFGANHNSAFRESKAEFFCVLNPDVRMSSDVLPTLLEQLRDHSLGAIGPCIVGAQGQTEQSARRFPTPWSILLKGFGVERPESWSAQGMSYPDWIGGMFMLFPRVAFARARGFDERYFLYYEDVDLCARLQHLGYRIGYCADACAVHNARRSSHRDPRYLRWHLASMGRFFFRRAVGRL